MHGAAKISAMNPIETNVRVTPEMAASIAARGMSCRSESTKKTPTSSSSDESTHAARPMSYAARDAVSVSAPASSSRRYVGAISSCVKAKKGTMLTPIGSAVLGLPVRRPSAKPCSPKKAWPSK